MGTTHKDRISQRAAEALALGMSYGKYMAVYHPSESRQEPVKPRTGVTKVCEYCGMEFTRYDKRQRKYCCEDCQEAANDQKSRERKMAQRISERKQTAQKKPVEIAVMKVCPYCGVQFKPKSGHMKYCSDMCRRIANADRCRLAYYRKKRLEVGAHELEI